MKKNTLLILLISIGLLFSKCHKADRDDDKETQSSDDNMLAENTFTDIFNQIDHIANEEPDLNKNGNSNIHFLSTCPTFTITPTLPDSSFPKTLTIDFGDSTNCLGTDGVNRRGKIVATFSGKYKNLGTVISVYLSNYYVNDFHVEGTKNITNMGFTNNGNPYFKVNVSNAKITSPTGKSITWSSQRTKEWIAGDTSASLLDDVYLITGTASGTGISGNTFNATITNALKVAPTCRWIESGTIKLTPQNLTPRIIDFGNGDCDNKATVTINGHSNDITMK